MDFLRTCPYRFEVFTWNTWRWLVLIWCLKWCPMLQQKQETLLRQILLVRIANNTQKIQSSDWPTWRCALWRYVISHRLWPDGPDCLTNELSIWQLQWKLLVVGVAGQLWCSAMALCRALLQLHVYRLVDDGTGRCQAYQSFQRFK